MSRTKYVLIERTDGYNPIAMSPETAQDLHRTPFSGTTAGEPKPITLTRIRKERIRIYSDEEHAGYLQQCAEHEEFSRLREKYHKKPLKAIVDWFNPVSGVGYVTIQDAPELPRFPIWACNIEGRKTWYPGTACVYYTEGQVVDVELDMHAHRSIFCLGLTTGTLDVEGWDRIKGDNLAFRCDEQGKAITGLLG